MERGFYHGSKVALGSQGRSNLRRTFALFLSPFQRIPKTSPLGQSPGEVWAGEVQPQLHNAYLPPVKEVWATARFFCPRRSRLRSKARIILGPQPAWARSTQQTLCAVAALSPSVLRRAAFKIKKSHFYALSPVKTGCSQGQARSITSRAQMSRCPKSMIWSLVSPPDVPPVSSPGWFEV